MTASNLCPGCSGKLKATAAIGVYRCRSCAGDIATHIYLGDSFARVSPYWENGDYSQTEIRYFDHTCLSSEGIIRRHGWYLPRTGRTVQVG